MAVKDTLISIFQSIASKLGLEIYKKSSTDEYEYADDGVNPIAIGANVVANIAVDDSDIRIIGDNERAKALELIKEYYEDEIQTKNAEVVLGTGDSLIRPYTDGEDFGLDVIPKGDFAITKAIGDKIKGVIMKLEEYTTDKNTYRLFESQEIINIGEQKAVKITRIAYKDDKEVSILNTHWKDYEAEETIIADQLLVARYKCPTINRDNINAVDGVQITYGCDNIIEEIKKKYELYNDEIDAKQAFTFADRSLFHKSKNGKELVFDKERKYIMPVTGAVDGNIQSQIQVYSPDIRTEQFKNGNDFNLSMLEMCCGFSRGVFTAPETSFATATEMKNSLKKTFAFIKRFRKALEKGDRQLFNAINIIMNLNKNTVYGEWDIQHSWSYDYIESTTEKFNQMLQLNGINAVSSAEARAWALDEDLDVAEQKVKEIKENLQVEALAMINE